MALRELFATFDFEWNRSTLGRINAAVDGVEAGARHAAAAFDRIGSSTARARGPLAAWRQLAMRGGASASTFGAAIRGLAGNVARAATEDHELAASFRELGIDVEKLSQSGRSASSIWLEVTGRLAGVESKAKRARLALRLLGDTGARVAAPGINQGRAGLRTALKAEQAPPARAADPAVARAREQAAALRRLRAESEKLSEGSFRREVRAQTGIIAQLRRAIAERRRLRREAAAAGAGAEPRGLERMRGALRRVTAEWRRQRRAAREARGEIDSTGRAMRGVSGSASVTSGMLQAAFWTGLARSVAQTTLRLGELAARGAGMFTGRVFELSTWAESVRKGLGMVSGLGEQKGAAEFEHAREAAVSLGLDLQPTIDAYKQLRNVGFEADKALNLTRLTADLKQGLGLTDEATGRILLALGQIKGAGRLQGDELRQLQETGLNIDKVWESISEQLGVSVQKAMKLKEAGKVSADVAIKAVEAATLGTLGTSRAGEAAEKLASTTMRGGLGKAKAAFNNWLLSIGQTLEPTFNDLAKTIAGTLAKFDSDGTFQRVTETITRLIRDFIDLVILHWPRIERIIRRTLGGASDGIGDFIMQLDHLIERFLDAVEWIQDHWEEVKTTVVAGAVAMGAALAAIAVASVVNAIASIGSAMLSVAGGARKATSAVWGLVKALDAKSVAEAGGTGAAAKGAAGGAAAKGAAGAGAKGALGALGGLAVGVGAAVVGGLLTTGDSTPEQQAKIRERAKQGKGLSDEGRARVEQLRRVREQASSIGEINRTYQAPTITPISHTRAITINDQRKLSVAVESPTPGATAAAVGKAVQRQSGADLQQLQGALVGAEHG